MNSLPLWLVWRSATTRNIGLFGLISLLGCYTVGITRDTSTPLLAGAKVLCLYREASVVLCPILFSCIGVRASVTSSGRIMELVALQGALTAVSTRYAETSTQQKGRKGED